MAFSRDVIRTLFATVASWEGEGREAMTSQARNVTRKWVVCHEKTDESDTTWASMQPTSDTIFLDKNFPWFFLPPRNARSKPPHFKT